MAFHTRDYDSDGLYTLGRQRHKPFKMKYWDRSSLNEIKKRLSGKGYGDCTELHDHLLFLEHLAEKLSNTLRLEQADGEPAWTLKREISEVKATFDALNEILHRQGCPL